MFGRLQQIAVNWQTKTPFQRIASNCLRQNHQKEKTPRNNDDKGKSPNPIKGVNRPKNKYNTVCRNGRGHCLGGEG